MRKLVSAAILLLLAAALGACAGTQEPTPAPEPGAQGAVPTPGTWENNIFTSEALGLRVILPGGWMTIPATDLATLDDDPDMPAEIKLVDMVAANLVTGEAISIFYSRVEGQDATAALSGDALRALIREVFGPGVLFDGRGTTRIGAYAWEPFWYRDAIKFVSFEGGLLRDITILAAPEAVDGILTFFTGLDDPRPEPGLTEALVGIWVWEEYEGLSYTFSAAGRGRRGISATGFPFTWSTTADGGLTIALDGAAPGQIQVEAWSYLIEGDLLTMTSRQVPGMTERFLRQAELEPIATPDALSDDIHSLMFSLDGVLYTLPLPFAELEALGWALELRAGVEEEEDLEDAVLAPLGRASLLQITNGTQRIRVELFNPTEHELSLREGLIAGIAVHTVLDDQARLVFPGHITIGTPYDEVIAAHGEADMGLGANLTYASEYARVNLLFDEKTSLVESLMMDVTSAGLLRSTER